MADITVDVNLPSSVSVDVTSPTQVLATNVSIPGPQGPRGEKGNPTSINNLTAENIIITGSDGNVAYTSGTSTIFISGNSGYFQSAVNSLTTNLNNTGANLNTSINNLSGLFTGYTGTLDATYATDSQLANTGSTLNTKIDNLSGYVNSQDSNISNNLASTGSSLQSNINTLSSNLSLTGSNLNDKINSLSGTLTGNYLTTNSASSTYATITNLNSTGNTLNSNISALSGTLTSNYATINNLALTGSNLNTKIDNFSGTYQNFVNNLDASYATDVQLQNTGSTLSQNINSLSGTLTNNYYLKSNPSGFITGVDLSSYLTSSTASSTYATINNLTSTGSTLNNNINALSGTLTSNYATITNLASTGSTLASSINSLNSAFTGFTGNLDATYATDSQLATTGTTLVSSISSLSGTLTSNYATITNLASTGSTLINTISSLSGTLTSNYATINNLNSTGSTLETSIASTGNTLNLSINSLSGTLTSTYATITNLASTGSTLNNSINSLSGTLTSTYATINNLASTGSTLATNLANTGSNLDAKINALSGSAVLLYGNQTINGLKDFTTRPTVNTTPVLLSGENANGLTVLVKNDESTTLLKGQPVYIYGANGNNILVRKASNTGEAYSSKTLGLLAQDLTSNAQGLVITEGSLEGINTNAGNAGDPIWLGPTGDLIFGLAQKPYAPNHLVYLGVIERKQSNNGKIYVKVQNGFELHELHNVNINHKNVLNDNDIIRYNSASGLWFNETLNTGIFQTQINSLSGSSVLLYGDQSVGGVKTFRDNVYINNLFVTGTETIVSTNNFNVQSPYVLLNLTGGAVDGGIFFVTGSGLTGVNDTGPIIGFDHSNKFKFGVSTRNSDLSTLPDIASVQDIIAYSGVANNTFSTITNLASTGNTLEGKISSLSGTLTSNYATISNLASTGSTLVTNLASTGSTLNSSINSLSGTLTSNYATITNLASTGSTLATNLANTGSTLNTRINNLSGYINSTSSNIVFTTGNQTISGTKTFIQDTTFGDSAQGDFLVISGNNFTVYGSGNFTSGLFVNSSPVLTGSSTLYATSVNLASTGSTLNSNINSLSGTLTSTYATITNLASTGSTLDTKINNLSGYINSTGSNILFTTGDQTVNGNKSFTSSSVLTVKTISGFKGASPDSLNLIATNDNTVVANVNLPGNINLTAGTGSTFGTSTYGNINLNAGGPKYEGQVNLFGNVSINNTNSNTLLNSRTIKIYKTGFYFGNPATAEALTIDNNNISINTVVGGDPGFGLLISGVAVTPALYATSANLASTGSTLNSSINSLSGYVNSTNSNIVFTTGDQSIGGDKIFTNKLNITSSATSDSALKVGTLELQPYSVNNAWFGDNTYYNGEFYRREAGYAGAFYFQGPEGQFRFAGTDDANTTYTPAVQLKTHLDGRFGVGSDISTATDDFTNSNFFVNSNGNVGINTLTPSEKLEVVGNIIGNNLVYNTGNQTISGVKTFIGDHNISGNLRIDGDILRSGNSIYPLMGPAFPKGTNKRIHLPAGLTYATLGGAPVSTNANSGVMNLNPYYLPTDMTGSNIILTSSYFSTSANPAATLTTGVLAFGIYDAKSGLENATLMESFLRSGANRSSEPTVFRQSLSKFYPQGWYITVAARVFSGTQGTGNVSYNAANPQNLHIFGTPSGSANYNTNTIPNGYIQSAVLTVTGMTYPFPSNFSSIPLSSFVIGQTSTPPPIYLMY